MAADVYRPRAVADVADATALGTHGAQVYVGTSRGSVVVVGGDEVHGAGRLEQIGGIPGTPYVACLADGVVSVCTPDSLDARTRLPLTHGASLFAADAYAADDACVSVLAVACKRRIVLYRWVDGVFWDAKVHDMPRTPRTLALVRSTLFAGYGQYEYVRVVMRSVRASSVAWRTPPADALTSGTWVDTHAWDMYAVRMPRAAEGTWWPRRPRVLAVALDDEVMLATEQAALFVDEGGSRTRELAWRAPPRHALVCAPYLFLAHDTLDIYMQATLRHVQTLALNVRHMAQAQQQAQQQTQQQAPQQTQQQTQACSQACTQARTPYVCVAQEVLALDAAPLDDRLAALTAAGEYRDALALVCAQDPHSPQRPRLVALVGVAAYTRAAFDEAADRFIEADMNPAYVLALYPAEISGAFARAPDAWPSLFGAQVSGDACATPAALDALTRYLNDRRRILRGAAEPLPPAAAAAQVDTHAAWSWPMCGVAPGGAHAAAFAQMVDTALLRVFLHTKPALVGPMCRVENSCDVEQVKDALVRRGMQDALVALYKTKRMHAAALDVIRERPDACAHTAEYLASLGPEHTDVILTYVRGVLDADAALGLSIFTSEPHLQTLDAERVAHALEAWPDACLAYLDAVMRVRDVAPALHTLRARLLLAARHDDALPFMLASHAWDAAALDASGAPPRVQALVAARRGDDDAALTLYVDSGDVPAALAYCTAAHKPQLYTALLARVMAHAPHEIDALCAQLAAHAAHLDVPAILALLPREWPVARVTHLLTASLQAQSVQRADARVRERLCEADLASLRTSVYALSQRRVVVTDTRPCVRCERRLGRAVLAVIPRTGALMHYSCMDR